MMPMGPVDVEPVIAARRLPPATRGHGKRVLLPGDRWRLLAFMFTHMMTLATELIFVIYAIQQYIWALAVPTTIALLLTGTFCAHTAWHADLGASRCLPLRSHPVWLGCLLALPYGWLQMVVVEMAWQEFRARAPNPLVRNDESQNITVNRFHLKAVNGITEGVIFSSAITFTLWSTIDPHQHPGLEIIVGVAGIIVFISAGLGLLELDFCVSDLIAGKVRKSFLLELLHLTFRTSEVWTRVSLFTFWCFITQPIIGQSCMLILPADIMLTLILITTYSGLETSWLVRVLVGIPCSFANLFYFVDSPSKRRAARKLSTALTIKNFLELPLILAGACLVNKDVFRKTQILGGAHAKSTFLSLLAVTSYVILLAVMNLRDRKNPKDIFSACEDGDLDAVLNLTSRAAVAIDINCRDVAGQTPLMIAVRKGHAEICRVLVEERAAVDMPSVKSSTPWIRCWGLEQTRWTALHVAARRGDSQVVRALLEGITANSTGFIDGSGNTPLHTAALFGKTEAAQLVICKRPDWLDIRNHAGLTPAECTRCQQSGEALLAFRRRRTLRQRSAPLLAEEASQHTQEVGAQPPTPLASWPRTRCERSDASQNWPQVKLQISRNACQESSQQESWDAPGLCSFVAASSGGVLGRFFLINALQRGPLGTIVEGSPFREEESLAVADGGGCVSQEVGPGDIPVPPAFDDLEPVDKNGTPPDDWQCLPSDIRVLNPPDEAVLGQGSYGTVWRARDKASSQLFAVKNIVVRRRNMSALALRDTEAADMVRVNPHPCLVQLYHIEHFPRLRLYSLVMEFCPGGDLQDRVRKAKQDAISCGRPYSPPEETVAWLGQVFLGLEHLHLKMGALLRDMKADNVVLSAEGRAKIIDFGFCRLSPESDGTWTFGVPPGSPGYVSPEVIRGEKYTFPADLYSYGVVAWLLFSGGITAQGMDGLPEPIPPFSRMRHGQDYVALYQDYRLLREHILNPGRGGTRELSDREADFVLQLVHRRPESRLNHEQVRRHPLMQHLCLPPLQAGRGTVEDWLRTSRLANP